MAFCSDDKSKIHVVEPDTPVSIGVRGRENITPKMFILVLDHYMHKSSLTPDVGLRCDIPGSTDKCFLRGNVHYTVSDSLFSCLLPFVMELC